MTVLTEHSFQVVLSQIALGQAVETARRGDLDAAATQLIELDEAGVATPEVLDLLARIRAQQKKWPEADRYWARVQEVRPDDPAAAAGRTTIAEILAGRRRSRPILSVVGTAAVTALIVVVGSAMLLSGDDGLLSGSDGRAAAPDRTASTHSSPGTSLSPSEPPSSAAEEERARADRLARQLATIEAQRRAAAAAVDTKLTAIQRKVIAPGRIVRRQPGAIRVLFAEGLFVRNTDLTPAGRTALLALGKDLTDLDVNITVTGHSVVIPGSTSGGSTMALLRARTATRYLTTASGLPLTSFTLQSADQQQSPFHTPTQNRTVSLTLTPR